MEQQGLDPASKTWPGRYGRPVCIPAEIVFHRLKRLDMSTQEADPLYGRAARELAMVPGLRNSLELYRDYSYVLGKMVLRLTGWVLRDEHQHEVVTKTMAIRRYNIVDGKDRTDVARRLDEKQAVVIGTVIVPRDREPMAEAIPVQPALVH